MRYNARTISPIHLAYPFMEENLFFIAEALLGSRCGKIDILYLSPDI